MNKLVVLGWLIVLLISCTPKYYDYGGEYYTTLSELYDRQNKERSISYIVEFNTPEHIEQYYRNYARDKGLKQGLSKSVIQRYVQYSQRHIWFNITARSRSMQNLLLDFRENFVLINDRLERCKPEVIGEGTYPKYKPLGADGHIYDEPCWEITFGLVFPNEMRDDETEWLKLLVSNWDDAVVYTWRKGDVP
ncbi:MAG: hypothetical protein KBA26_00470 [Candidatus Delongbacteria bacterium]|nr:hypothetical protein [Candidatus Delongbacteria bacterium]